MGLFVQARQQSTTCQVTGCPHAAQSMRAQELRSRPCYCTAIRRSACKTPVVFIILVYPVTTGVKGVREIEEEKSKKTEEGKKIGWFR